MLDLNPICDECLKNLGIADRRMVKTSPAAIFGGVGETYVCEHCGTRRYGTVSGYFSLTETGIDVKPQPHCDCKGISPLAMYIRNASKATAGASRERATFACPSCGAERETDL